MEITETVLELLIRMPVSPRRPSSALRVPPAKDQLIEVSGVTETGKTCTETATKVVSDCPIIIAQPTAHFI